MPRRARVRCPRLVARALCLISGRIPRPFLIEGQDVPPDHSEEGDIGDSLSLLMRSSPQTAPRGRRGEQARGGHPLLTRERARMCAPTNGLEANANTGQKVFQRWNERPAWARRYSNVGMSAPLGPEGIPTLE